jgi:hypothetical protein
VLIRPISRRSVCPEIYSSSLGPQTELRRRLVTVAAVDVERAADLYAQGWTLRQIGTELGLSSTTVSDQLRRAGVTMRRASPPAYSASTQQILELRDQGLAWNEVAKQVDMTVSGAWSRYRRTRPPKQSRPVVASRFSPTPSMNTLLLAYEPPSLIISVEPPPELSSPPHDEPPTVASVCCTCRRPMRTRVQGIATISCWRSRV